MPGTGSACQVSCVRTTILLSVLTAALAGGCADAPITPEHILPDGQLRAEIVSQAAFAARPERAEGHAVQIAAVLAAEAAGPLVDAAAFPAEVEAVHLHIRADSLLEARSVTFVWTYGETREEVAGVLAPTTTLALAASHPVGPEQRGLWRVEVFTLAGDEPAQLLFAREFEVL